MRLVTATSTLKLIGHVRDVVLALDLGLHISLIPRPSHRPVFDCLQLLSLSASD